MLIRYSFLKPQPEVLRHSPRTLPLVLLQFHNSKNFQFVSCLWPTFKDLSIQVSPQQYSIPQQYSNLQQYGFSCQMAYKITTALQ